MVEKLEGRIKQLYLKFVIEFEGSDTHEEVLQAVRQGDISRAVELMENAFEEGMEEFAEIIQSSSKNQLLALAALLGVKITYDITNRDLQRLIIENRDSLLNRLRAGQRDALNRAIVAAATEGRSAQDAITETLGLSGVSIGALIRYRNVLRNQAADDAREGRSRMSDEQITRMVGAYRKKLLVTRAEQVARVTAVRAVSEAKEWAIRQAVEQNAVDPQRIVRVWNRIPDDRVRDAHDVMQGQKAGIGETFTDGDGNVLRYPGDPQAPIETVANCRCSLTIQIK